MIGELHEECAVAAAFLKRPQPGTPGGAAAAVYTLLAAQTNRGDLSSGLATYNPTRHHLLDVYRGKGTPPELFGKPGSRQLAELLEAYDGPLSIGHNRYATSGKNTDPRTIEYAAQPFLREHPKRCKEFAFCYNGNLPNAQELRDSLRGEVANYHFKTDTDTELIRIYITRFLRPFEARLTDDDYVALFADLASRFDGAYNICFCDANGTLVLCRDPNGFRPLAYAENEDLFAAASESSALRLLGLDTPRALGAGELLIVDERGLRLRRFAPARAQTRCAFELIYFMKSGSVFDGVSVQGARERIGAELAKVERFEIGPHTVVAPVPKTGIPMRTGYVNELLAQGRPVRISDALILEGNERTFIADFGPQDRFSRMRFKFDMTPGYLRGKDVLLIDDSIVRGNTCRQLVRYVREHGGARSVHLRIGAPPNRFPCYYGINMPTRTELVAAHRDTAAVQREIGVDSLVYIGEEALLRALGRPDGSPAEPAHAYCLGCFNGRYPTPAATGHLAQMLATEGAWEPSAK